LHAHVVDIHEQLTSVNNKNKYLIIEIRSS